MTPQNVRRILRDTFGGAGLSWGSLVRIHIWALVAVLLVGNLLPPRPRDPVDLGFNRVAGLAQNDNVTVVSPPRNDIRGFVPTEAEDDTFRIAWLGGSSLQSISEDFYTFVPAEVQPLISEVDGQRVTVDTYFLSGMRIVDEYFALLAALEDDVDMVVIAVNPIWALNNTATHDWPELDAATLRLGITEPSAWPFLASYLSPADGLYAPTSALVDGVADRTEHSSAINDLFSNISVLDRTTPNEQPPPDELGRIRQMTIPVAFWRTYRQPPIPGATLEERQLQFLLDSDLANSTINIDVLREMGRITEEAGVFTYAYVAPLNHESLADDGINNAVLEIEASIAEVDSAFSAQRQRLQPQTASRFVPPFEFDDIIHIQETGELADHLAGEICTLLNENELECQR